MHNDVLTCVALLGVKCADRRQLRGGCRIWGAWTISAGQRALNYGGKGPLTAKLSIQGMHNIFWDSLNYRSSKLHAIKVT